MQVKGWLARRLDARCYYQALACPCSREECQWSKDAPDNSPVLAIAGGLPNDDTNHVEPSSNGDPSENNNQEPNNDDAEGKDDQATDDAEESSSSSSSSLG